VLRATGDILDIEILTHILRRIATLWNRLTLPSVTLLPEFDGYELDRSAIRYLARKRRRCTLNGHMWEFKEIQMDRISYVVECVRCSPHIDSRRVIVSYNPFPTVERKTD
jgi:hypothetical protein